MFLCILIINQHISILIISVRFLLRDLDDLEAALDTAPDTRTGLGARVGFDEDQIHLFERAVGCFRVEEVDDGEDECVDNGEDDLKLG